MYKRALQIGQLNIMYVHLLRKTPITNNEIKILSNSTSDQARLPAEFKHIIKRRKRNQTGFP